MCPWSMRLEERVRCQSCARRSTRVEGSELQGGIRVSDHVYRVTEIVGSSPDSVDAAIRNGATRAAKTLHHLDWFEVTEIRGNFTDEVIAHFQVTMKVGFRLDDDPPEGWAAYR